MFTGVYQSLVLLLTIVVFYAADFFLMRRFDKLRAPGFGSSRSWSYTLLAFGLGGLVVAQPVFLPQLSFYTPALSGLALQIFGILLIGSGLLLHWWARVHLGQFYGEREEVQPGQYLITRGPYAYIRHPLYTTYYLISIGYLLVCPSLVVLAVVGWACWDFTQAVFREEKLLADNLPGYAEYMKRTPRFLPKLGRTGEGQQ